MDPAILAAEVVQPQYADRTDEEVAQLLNAPGPTTLRMVPVADLHGEALRNGLFLQLKRISLDNTMPVEARALAETMLALTDAKFDAVDLHVPASQAMLAALQQHGMATPEQIARIVALAEVRQPSRAQALWGQDVTAEEVAAARAWWAEQQAEQERRQAYALLRERLNAFYGAALAQLAQMEASGAKPPTAEEVLGWLAR